MVERSDAQRAADERYEPKRPGVKVATRLSSKELSAFDREMRKRGLESRAALLLAFVREGLGLKK